MQVGISICNLLKYLKKSKEISIQKKKKIIFCLHVHFSLCWSVWSPAWDTDQMWAVSRAAAVPMGTDELSLLVIDPFCKDFKKEKKEVGEVGFVSFLQWNSNFRDPMYANICLHKCPQCISVPNFLLLQTDAQGWPVAVFYNEPALKPEIWITNQHLLEVWIAAGTFVGCLLQQTPCFFLKRL